MYAEDLHPGTTIELGSYLVTREEIVEFATQWDPHSIHSMAIFQRLAVDGAFSHWR